MRLLLDTHAFIWFVEDSPLLSADAKSSIGDPGSEVFLSIASVWEMAIKVSLNKLRFSQPFDLFLPHQLRINDIATLNVTLEHAMAVSKLPLHHRDPFDRMIIAQSLTEGIVVVSVDAAFDRYGVTRLW